MTFFEEVQTISKTLNNPNLEPIKDMIRRSAASGGSKVILDSGIYDFWIIKWLRAEGFIAEETMDPRDGNFLTIKW